MYNCLLPFLLLFLLLDSTNLIRAHYMIERKSKRFMNSSLDAIISMLPFSVVWWPIQPLPGKIPKDVAYVHGLPPSRA